MQKMDTEFIDDFIKEYKNQPCLWQASCIDFKNREKRQEAYCKLIEVASKHGLHYNIERTKQKINNLRCAFRNQLKKFTESKNNKGKEDNYNYCPKRRYFESLMFLLNEEGPERPKPEKQQETSFVKDEIETQEHTETYAIPLESEDNSKETTEILAQPVEDDIHMEAHKENNVHMEVHCDEDGNMMWPRIPGTPKPTETVLHVANATVANAVPVETEQRQRTVSISSQTSSHIGEEENAPKKIKIDCSATNFEKLLSLACSKINYPDRQDDEFSIFGKMVAYKLRSMDTQQSIIAEKMITDILLEGQMKMLSYPIRAVPYRQDGQAFVISSLNLNGTADSQSDRPQQYSTIQYSTGGGSQL